MGVTLTDVLLFGKARLTDVDKATLVIYRRNILRWSALGGYLEVIVKGVSPLSLPDAIANSISYVKAFGGTEQRNIPQPYTQVNYVTNTAQTAVDTGIMIDFAKNYEFEVECRAVSGSWYILQSRASASGNVTGIHGETSGSTIKLVVGNVTVCTSAITRTVGNKLYVKATLNAGIATLYVKDETANTEDTQTGSYGTSQPNPTASVYLLGNAGGQYVDVNSDIYMARIKENDTVVMDYVPARQVATAGFYDKASGTFKTALTPANLSADGNTVPTPDAPMDIVSNNGVLKYRDTELPVGYRRILGMTMNNDCYYQTTTYPTGADTLKFSYEWTSETACNVLGCYTTSSAQDNISLYIGSNPSAKYLRYDGGTASSYSLANKRYDVQITPTGSIGMEIEDTWEQKTFTCSVPLCIGITGATATSAKFIGNLYGNVEIIGVTKFIPCERVSDGEIGYYDTANETFITPTGTTPTSLGYDYSHYAVIADGTVETINARGKNLFDIADADWGYNINASGVRSESQYNSNSNYIKVKPNTQYTCSWISNAGTTSVIVRFHAYNSSKAWLQQIGILDYAGNGLQTYTFTTSANTEYVIFTFRGNSSSASDLSTNIQLERDSTATAYVPYYDGGTATAEMLLKVGDYQDVQSIIDGVVTRNVGVKVLDGTENWKNISNFFNLAKTDVGSDSTVLPSNSTDFVCSHFAIKTYQQLTSDCVNIGGSYINFKYDSTITVLADWKTWLANQYAAGTPVIILYPLATPTTESVTGQTLQVTDGDNVLEITQASLNGLELEAQYQAAVSLTIQEVQDANLDPNVEVTIN